MTISDSTLRNSVFTDVKACLVAASITYYNNSNVAVQGVTITASYIDDDQSFPQIVINNANVGKDEFSMNKANSTKTIQVMIDIYDTKAKNIDSICDQISALSSLYTIRGLSLVNWDEEIAFSPVNDKKLHLKTITLTYKRR